MKKKIDCWASKVGNCSFEQTKEHIVSKNLFPESVTVQGFSWCKSKPKEVGINSLTSKILCRFHNNALSDFDKEAGVLFKAIKDLAAYSKEVNSRVNKIGISKKKYNVNGKKIERWFTKTLINCHFTELDENTKINLPYLLDILFNRKDFVKPFGLHGLWRIGHDIISQDKLIISSIINARNSEVVGGIFEFLGFGFLLKFPSIDGLPDDDLIQVKESLTHFDGMKSIWHIEKMQEALPGSNDIFQIIKFYW